MWPKDCADAGIRDNGVDWQWVGGEVGQCNMQLPLTGFNPDCPHIGLVRAILPFADMMSHYSLAELSGRVYSFSEGPSNLGFQPSLNSF